MPKSTLDTPARFYSLDVLRGVAALGVVCWHWRHFFFVGTHPGTFDVTSLPFFGQLFLFYTQGWLAVDLFFCLSGFVFYWLYSKPVADATITPTKFTSLRFSRLYPLHFATLLVVAIGQFWMFNMQGNYFVYPHNDGKHFLLNLFLTSSWGREGGESFNGPIWSVSVEVFLYGLFFTFCRLLPVKLFVLVSISMVGFFVLPGYLPLIGRGVGSFFLGGCVFLIYQWAIASTHIIRIAKWSVFLALVAWITTFIAAQPWVKPPPFFSVRTFPYLEWIIPKVVGHWATMVLFPLSILTLTLVESLRGTLGRRVSFLGDISYSSYLLHFPLQLLIVALVSRLGVSTGVYYAPWFFILFLIALILLSIASYKYFEMPAQRFLRQNGGASKSKVGLS